MVINKKYFLIRYKNKKRLVRYIVLLKIVSEDDIIEIYVSINYL